MCVWLKYEELDQLEIGIHSGLVKYANGEELKNSHPFDEFMTMASEHDWEPIAKPEEPNTTKLLHKKPSR